MQEPLHQTYQDIAHAFATGYTLKTDVWQETRDKYEAPITAHEYLEILPDLVEKARERGLKATQGSITEMPYADGTFDTLIDTSTIDHVPNYGDALKEYARVLKPMGKMLLITWVTPKPTWIDGTDLAGGTQYYFNEPSFTEKLAELFDITDRQVLRDVSGQRMVVAYKCLKK